MITDTAARTMVVCLRRRSPLGILQIVSLASKMTGPSRPKRMVSLVVSHSGRWSSRVQDLTCILPNLVIRHGQLFQDCIHLFSEARPILTFSGHPMVGIPFSRATTPILMHSRGLLTPVRTKVSTINRIIFASDLSCALSIWERWLSSPRNRLPNKRSISPRTTIDDA